MTIYLVRHAHAGSRSQWTGGDSARPLSKKGQREAEAINAWFAGRKVDRVLSSPAVRCEQTVSPLATARKLRVERMDALAEGSGARPISKLIWELATDEVRAVVCSHGDVIPSLLGSLADDGVDVTGDQLPKGTLYRLAIDDGRITSATFVDPR